MLRFLSLLLNLYFAVAIRIRPAIDIDEILDKLEKMNAEAAAKGEQLPFKFSKVEFNIKQKREGNKIVTTTTVKK